MTSVFKLSGRWPSLLGAMLVILAALFAAQGSPAQTSTIEGAQEGVPADPKPIILLAAEDVEFTSDPTLARRAAVWEPLAVQPFPGAIAGIMACSAVQYKLEIRSFMRCRPENITDDAGLGAERALELATVYLEESRVRLRERAKSKLIVDVHQVGENLLTIEHPTRLPFHIEGSAIGSHANNEPFRTVDPNLMPRPIFEGMRYPSRAVRRELQGNLHVTCRVFGDYSVLCGDYRFDPAQNGEFFIEAAERHAGGWTMPERLLDGSSSAATRFESVLVFRLNQAEPRSTENGDERSPR